MNKRLGILFPLVMAMMLAVSACDSSSNDDSGSSSGSGSSNSDSGSGSAGSNRPDLVPQGDEGSTSSSDALSLAQAGEEPPSTQYYNYTVEEYISYIVNDLDVNWTNWFLQNGYSEPDVYYQIVSMDTTYTSSCKNRDGSNLVVDSDYKNAFYCAIDVNTDSNGVSYKGALIFPVTTMQKMWTGDMFGNQSIASGDFGAAMIVAHEFGHHIQDELMLQHRQLTGGDTKAPTGKNKELIADCFAGVWTASAYYSGLLEDGDFDEAVAGLEAIARTPSDTHGSSAERVQAIQTGYNGIVGYNTADPQVCIDTYWR